MVTTYRYASPDLHPDSPDPASTYLMTRLQNDWYTNPDPHSYTVPPPDHWRLLIRGNRTVRAKLLN